MDNPNMDEWSGLTRTEYGKDETGWLNLCQVLSQLKSFCVDFKASIGLPHGEAGRRSNSHERDAAQLERDRARAVEFLEGLRCVGNKAFQMGDWIGARAMYTGCLAEASSIGESLDCKSEEFNNVLKLTYSHRAETWLRVENFAEAVVDAEAALKIDPTHVKSLIRLGRAKRDLGFSKDASKAFEEVDKHNKSKANMDNYIKETMELCSPCDRPCCPSNAWPNLFPAL